MAIDFNTDEGKVRLLIPDLDEADHIFTIEEIQGFLAIEETVKSAAAQALDTIATTEALIGKVLKTQDLTTDAAKLADALHKRAESLRKQDEEDGESAGFFDVVDFAPYGLDGAELTEG